MRSNLTGVSGPKGNDGRGQKIMSKIDNKVSSRQQNGTEYFRRRASLGRWQAQWLPARWMDRKKQFHLGCLVSKPSVERIEWWDGDASAMHVRSDGGGSCKKGNGQMQHAATGSRYESSVQAKGKPEALKPVQMIREPLEGSQIHWPPSASPNYWLDVGAPLRSVRENSKSEEVQ